MDFLSVRRSLSHFIDDYTILIKIIHEFGYLIAYMISMLVCTGTAELEEAQRCCPRRAGSRRRSLLPVAHLLFPSFLSPYQFPVHCCLVVQRVSRELYKRKSRTRNMTALSSSLVVMDQFDIQCSGPGLAHQTMRKWKRRVTCCSGSRKRAWDTPARKGWGGFLHSQHVSARG